MKTFETEVYIMNIHKDGYLEFQAKKDSLLEPEDLWLARKQSLEYVPDKKYCVLMEAQDFFQIGTETRRVAASEEYSKDLIAVALYSKNLSLKILGSLYIKINRPPVPTKFFDYLACLKPQIGICTGELAKIIDTNKIGITLNDVGIGKFADVISTLKSSPSLIKSMEHNSLSLLQDYTVDNLAAKFDVVLKKQFSIKNKASKE